MSGPHGFLEATRALGWREILGRCFLGFLIAGALFALIKAASAGFQFVSDTQCAVVALDARTKALDARVERLERIRGLDHELEELREILEATGS